MVRVFKNVKKKTNVESIDFYCNGRCLLHALIGGAWF